MGEMLRLADNPLFVKHMRSRLRRSAVIPSLILVAFLSSCLLFLDLYIRFLDQPAKPNEFPVFYFLLVGLQTIILILIGGSQVSNSVAYIKDSGILDYHRITPVPANVQTLGFILGAPIREYIMFIITLPFAFTLAMVSDVGIGGFSKIFLVQVGGALLNHTIAFLVGLSAKTARGASGRYVGLLFAIYFGSSSISGFAMQSKEPYYGPSLISPYPVMYETFTEAMIKNRGAMPANPPGRNRAPQGPQGPMFAKPVDPMFLGIEFPLVIQTLMAQFALFFFLFIGASRRMHSSRVPIFSKIQAMSFFAVMTFFAVATLWKIPLEGLVIANVYGLMLFALMLIGLCTQPSGELQRGYQRAIKNGRQAPHLWDDLASNHGAILGITAIMTAFAVFHYQLMSNVAALPMGPPIESYVYGFGVAIGAILSIGFLIQHCALRFRNRWGRFGFYLFFLWFSPMIMALMAALIVDNNQAKGEAALLFLAATPVTSLPLVVTLERVGQQRDMVEHFRLIALVTVALETVLFLALSLRSERRLRNSIQDEQNKDLIEIDEDVHDL